MNQSITNKKKRKKDTVALVLIYLSSGFSIGLLLLILGYVAFKAVPYFSFKYLYSTTSIIDHTVGILPNIINTLYLVTVTLLIACPIGIGGAIYLHEYAKNQKLVRIVTFANEVLAGIPSIIYGLFGMLFFGVYLGWGFSILTGACTLSLMVLPIITRNTQTSLETVPKSYREAALGLGTNKWYMIRTVLLPSAIPGVLTGVILSIGRIISESAALLFTAGSGVLLPRGLFSHLFNSGATLTIQLYLEMSKANYENAFVIAFVLVIIVLLLNLFAKFIASKWDVSKVENNGK